MKKPIKLTIFNIAFIIIAILSFSKRGLGLGFDPSNGALRFALSVSLSIFGILIFFYGNYLILTKVEKIQNINPKDNLKIEIDFKADVNNYDIFYFSPNIEYQIQNEKRNIVIPFASYGLPIEENEMPRIYKEFKDNF